jgi:hypothetical protein
MFHPKYNAKVVLLLWMEISTIFKKYPSNANIRGYAHFACSTTPIVTSIRHKYLWGWGWGEEEMSI